MTTTATIDALKTSRIAILGYGSQGRAHALNLHESGLDVVVGVRKDGPSWNKAQADGLRVAEPADAVKEADLVAVLTPDMVQPALVCRGHRAQPEAECGACCSRTDSTSTSDRSSRARTST